MRQRHIIMWLFLFVMLIGIFWQSVPFIKDSVHYVLDPSLGKLLEWNLTYGMILLLAIINMIMVLVQKYATDQKALKELRKEQKEHQKQMREYRTDPAKMMDLNKKNMEFMKKTFSLTTQSWIYTLIPIVLLFRWFDDYFKAASIVAGSTIKFFGFFSWFWFYVLCSIIMTSIFRKVFDVA